MSKQGTKQADSKSRKSPMLSIELGAPLGEFKLPQILADAVQESADEETDGDVKAIIFKFLREGYQRRSGMA